MEAKYSKKSFDAVRVLNIPDDEESWLPGMFCYVVNGKGVVIGLSSCLPNAPNVLGNETGSSWGVCMFTGHGEQGKMWSWDGNHDRPTLHPSIHRKGHWHGYLVDGQFKSEK